MSTLVSTMSWPLAVSAAQATTYSAPWSPSRTRGVSNFRLRLPPRSTTPVMNSSASREIRPEPQMPEGGSIADHAIRGLVGLAIDPDFLDCPGRGAHAVFDTCAFEGRSSGAGTGDQPVIRA